MPKVSSRVKRHHDDRSEKKKHSRSKRRPSRDKSRRHSQDKSRSRERSRSRRRRKKRVIHVQPVIEESNACGLPTWLWLIISLLIIIGIGFAIFAIIRGRKGTNNTKLPGKKVTPSKEDEQKTDS